MAPGDATRLAREARDDQVEVLAVVGGDGFGFLPAGKGRVPHRVPHVGTVEIGDDVDIGSCAQVARSRFGRTVVGNGAKIDAMVQVAHNCRVGDGAILSAQVALAGSTVLGDGVLVGGQAGFAGHLEVGPGARIAGGSGIAKDVPAGAAWGGYLGRPVPEWMREAAALRRLAHRPARGRGKRRRGSREEE